MSKTPDIINYPLFGKSHLLVLYLYLRACHDHPNPEPFKLFLCNLNRELLDHICVRELLLEYIQKDPCYSCDNLKRDALKWNYYDKIVDFIEDPIKNPDHS